MSDGPSDAARTAEREARKFIKATYPALRLVEHPVHVPAKGKVVLLYEEWLDHIVEIVEDRKLLVRWRVKPNYMGNDPPVKLRIGNDSYNVGGLM